MRLAFKKYWVKGGVTLFGLLVFLIVTPLVYPRFLFAHKVEHGALRVYSDTPIPQMEASVLLGEIAERLAASPIKVDGLEMQIYITNTAWRRSWLWVVPPQFVGGFVVVPLTGQHTFFSGADFESNALIAPSGAHIQPPRTLVYYGAHEFTHVTTAATVGWVQFYQMPVWVKEGLADYAAMPAESAVQLYTKIGAREADLEMMIAYGVYAPYRLLVTYFLEEEGWTAEQLLGSRLTLEEARTIAFEHLQAD